MILNEELKKEENKKLFRELVKKYHPVMAGGSTEITQKLIDARISDSAFEAFVKELTGKKNPAKEEAPKEKKVETSDLYLKVLRKKMNEQEKWFEELGLKDVIIIPSVVLDPKAYYIKFDMKIKMGEYYARSILERTEKLFSKEEFQAAIKKAILRVTG
jgi:hypothetical protein